MTSDGRSMADDIKIINEESELTENLESTDFPEGGLRAWLVVLGSFISQFSIFGYLNAFGVYQDYYVRIYLNKYTASQISWIGSSQVFFILSMSILSGRAFDAGYFYHITIAGSLLFTFSLFMLSLTHRQEFLQVYLAQGLANSVAMGMLYVPSLAIVSHYFRRRRAFVMGISAAGSAVGGALHPIMLNNLFHRHGQDNFQYGVRASAAFNLCLLLISGLLMRPRLPPHEEEGSLIVKLQAFMREPPYMLATLGMFMGIIGFLFPAFFLQLYAIEQGVDPKLAFYSLTALNGASAIGRVASTLMVHKCGIMNGVLICSMSLTVIIVSMLAVKTATGVFLFGAVYGFFHGAYTGLLGPLIASLSKKDSEIGAKMGMCFAVAGIGGMFGNPIAGALLTSSFDWWKPTLFAGLVGAFASGSFFIARLLLSREKGTALV